MAPNYSIWVLNNSRFRKPQDIKGSKIGVFSVASTTTAFGILALKRVGLGGKDVKFIGVGGGPARVAALKSGAVDGFVQAYSANANLIARGEVRALINIGNYLPKPWIQGVYVAHKDFIEKNPKVVMKTIRGVFQAIDYTRANRVWAAKRLVVKLRFTPEGAKLAVAENILFPKLGRKISRPALQNVINFMAEYELMKKERLPSVDAMLYPSEFTR
jgi:ABC-type nitrate/sulfonate/bicarbonate transport system substrate-binding protein